MSTVKTNISNDMIEKCQKVLRDLSEISKQYSSELDITNLQFYDTLKKKVSANLEFLSTYKYIIISEYDRLEVIIKKERRHEFLLEIMKSKKLSYSRSDREVEIHEEYMSDKELLLKINKLKNMIINKYSFYSKLLESIRQSISTASKEKLNK